MSIGNEKLNSLTSCSNEDSEFSYKPRKFKNISSLKGIEEKQVFKQ